MGFSMRSMVLKHIEFFRDRHRHIVFFNFFRTSQFSSRKNEVLFILASIFFQRPNAT